MDVLKKGSIEPLLVTVHDGLENLTSLGDVTNLRFDVKRKIDAVFVQSNITATFEEFTAICMIDTTLSGYTVGETFHLYLKYTDGGATPVLGPVKFRVEDD